MVMILFTLSAAPDPASAGPRQDIPPEPTTDTAPVTAGSGDGTDTTEVDVVGPLEVEPERSDSDRAGDRVQLVIVALLVLALVVTAATVAFFVKSNPQRVASAEARVAARAASED